MMCNTEVDKPFNHLKFYRKFNENKGAVMFNAGYRGGRIFGEVSKLFALLYWAAKFFCEFMMGSKFLKNSTNINFIYMLSAECLFF